MSEVAPFHPWPLLGNPHLQTILASKVRLVRDPPSETRTVDLGDGDRLALEVSVPEGWTAGGPTAVLLHGLAGSHRSSYMVRATRRLLEAGIRAVRLNFRGCGTGHGLARRPYYGGCSHDVLRALEDLTAPDGAEPPVLVGYSLGGNVALKLAAELGEAGSTFLRAVVAVCPAADLHSCWERISAPGFRLYERAYVSWLRAEVAARRTAFPDLPPVDLPRELSLVEFDDRYTAPAWGFASAMDYYARCSAAPRMHAVRVPCRVLLALDDPVIAPTVLDRVDLPPEVEVFKVPHGGHVGFLGRPPGGGFTWLDVQVLRWVEEAFGAPLPGGPDGR